MADNVTLPGTGEIIATRETGSVEYQIVIDVLNTATLANVAGSASSVTLQASNAARRGWVCYNDSAAILYVKFGSTASATSFTYYVPPYGTLELPRTVYTGIITGSWASATGNARVTELTA